LERSILHADINNFYASVEQLYNPQLRGKAVIVAGSEATRHGIVLAKSQEAKVFGVKTAETIAEARGKCPHAIVVPPNYDKYLIISRKVRDIFGQYTDQVEPFGLDEAWLDVTESRKLFKDGLNIAEQMRQRVKKEIGVTISVGVSYNKAYAKLGSDMKKPDAITNITKSNYRQLVWPLPAGELLYVGRATQTKLAARSVNTIGDLANVPAAMLESWFGKSGALLHCLANGEDISPVARAGEESAIKSIGHSTTTPRDLECEEDCKIVFILLAECVAERMRDQGFKARTVQISLRSNDLQWIERQAKLEPPSNLSKDLYEAALILLNRNHDFSRQRSLRSIGIRAADLLPADAAVQTSLFVDEAWREKAQRLDTAIDAIRKRHGHHAIVRAVTSLDRTLCKIAPKDENGIQITGFSK
jgi:DNA polymerase-4